MINFNGNLISSLKEIFDSYNRAFKFGDALFETIKVEDLQVAFLEDHYFRLMASMRMLRMNIPMSFTMDFFESELLKTVKQNNLENARLRMTVFRTGQGNYLPESNNVDFIVEASKLVIDLKKSYSVDVFKDYFVYSGLLSTIKTTNRITNVLANIYASENGLDNCILLNESKHVVEAINGNIFLIKGNLIKTPSIKEGCVKGIIRKKIIEILSKNSNYSIEETKISPFEIQKADEVFITNAIVGIQSVTNYRKNIFKNTIAEELRVELKKLI